jgi:hypothetical protein
MQLVPGTARRQRVSDPEESILAGARHLRALRDGYGNDRRIGISENRNFKRPFGVECEVPNGHR